MPVAYSILIPEVFANLTPEDYAEMIVDPAVALKSLRLAAGQVHSIGAIQAAVLPIGAIQTVVMPIGAVAANVLPIGAIAGDVQAIGAVAGEIEQ